jgi:hypothetical protein
MDRSPEHLRGNRTIIEEHETKLEQIKKSAGSKQHGVTGFRCLTWCPAGITKYNLKEGYSMTKDKLKDFEGIKCPAGGTFGKSFFDYGYICEDCKFFEPCGDKIEELYGFEVSLLKLGLGKLPTIH